MNFFDKSHIPPSCRRNAHLSWVVGVNLLLNLLVGAGKFRYLSTNSVEVEQVEVIVHGFSAGSYNGLCLPHLLWKLPHVRTSGCFFITKMRSVLVKCCREVLW